MKITILKPTGYCFGVMEAIKTAKRAKKEHPDRDVFIIGMLVHNEDVINELTNLGITTLYKKGKSYKELVSEVEDDSIVVFSAHGHDKEMDEIAKNKNLIVYDAICPRVKANLDLIQNELAQNKTVIYIGQEKHPETIGALSISKDIILYDEKLLNNNQISTNADIFVINQTTLNYLDLSETFDKLRAKFPNISILGEVCSAARLRQQSIVNLDPEIDVLLVVGSTHSSNTKKLLEVAKSTHPTLSSHLVFGVEDVKKLNFQNKNRIAIASGASTPLEAIDAVYNYLNDKYNK